MKILFYNYLMKGWVYSFMDSKIKKYRTKHKKCKYYKYHIYEHWTNCCYGECVLKDKIINYKSLLRVCKYYELKGGK